MSKEAKERVRGWEKDDTPDVQETTDPVPVEETDHKPNKTDDEKGDPE